MNNHRKKHLSYATAGIVVALLAMTGCSTNTAKSEAQKSASSTSAVAKLAVNKALHNMLPDSVKKAGALKIVMPGTNEPWWHKDGNTYTGVAATLVKDMSTVLGVKAEFVAVPDLASAFASVKSGRYDAGFNPYGDTGSTNVDVIDVVKEIVPFLVAKGNPKNIGTMDSLCGNSIAANGPAGHGSAYYILQQQTIKCEAAGKKAIDIVPISGVPNGVLAVQSGRAAAYFSSGAPLFYYSANSDSGLQVVGTETDTGFSNLYQGMIIAKGSPLAEPMLGAFKEVFSSGAYKAAMQAGGLQREMIDAPGLDFVATRK